jgi:hypothetical protein
MRAVSLTQSVSPFSRDKKDEADPGLLQDGAERLNLQVAGTLGDCDRPMVQHARRPPDRPWGRQKATGR